MSDLDFRHILDLTRDAVVVSDRTGRVVYANRAAEALLRWPSGELLGKPLTAIIPPALRGKHTAGFNRHRATRSARILGRTIRVPALRRDGVEIRVELTLEAYRGGAGAEWYVGTLREAGTAVERGMTPALSTQSLRPVLAGLTPELPEAELARRVEYLFSAHLGTTHARLYRWHVDTGTLKLPAGMRPLPALQENLLEQEQPGLLRAALEAKTLAVTARVDQLPYDQGWLAEQQIRAAAAVPLLFAGVLEGLLVCLSSEEFTPEQQEMLLLAAVFLAAILREQDHRRLQAESRHQRAIRHALAEVLALIASGCELQPVLERIVEAAVQLTGADEGSLVLEEAPGGELVVRACAGYRTPITGMTIPRGLGVTGAVISSGGTVEVEDYQTFPQAVPRIKQRGVRAAVGAPIRSHDGRVGGALKLESKHQGFRFSKDEIALLEVLAALATLALRPADG